VLTRDRTVESAEPVRTVSYRMGSARLLRSAAVTVLAGVFPMLGIGRIKLPVAGPCQLTCENNLIYCEDLCVNDKYPDNCDAACYDNYLTCLDYCPGN
jgi:hypothetical protein